MPDVNHDTWDHAGVTGVPASEAFTEAAHDAHDHASVPGVGASGTATAEGPFDGERVRGLNLTKVGAIITRGGSGSWKEALVESPNIFWDPASGRYGMVFVGYSGTMPTPTAASLGLAWSDDLETWAEDAGNPFFSGSGVAEAPDESGCTGPFIWYEDGTYHLFYIGLPDSGYEGGTERICLATATDLFGTWTRHGAVISESGAGWRAAAIYHPNIVKRGATYYLFFNAAPTAGGTEQIGYATSSDLLSWTVDDANSPLLALGSSGAWDDFRHCDPYVYRVGETWYMAYYGDDGAIAQDGLAYTSDADFPLGWVKYSGNPILTIGGAGAPDAEVAAKPAIWITPTTHYHFYSARDASDPPEISIRLALERAAGVGPGGPSGSPITIDSGAAFPSTPADGDLFYRTDRLLLYQYVDAIHEWLTSNVYSSGGSANSLQSISASADITRFPTPPSRSIYVEQVLITWRVATTNNGSSFWTFNYTRVPATGASTTVGSLATSAGSANTWTAGTITVDAILDPSAVEHQVTALKTGSAGTLLWGLELRYREVG